MTLCSAARRNFQDSLPSTVSTGQTQQRDHYHSGSPLTAKECELGRKECSAVLLAQIEAVGFSRIPQTTESLDDSIWMQIEIDGDAGTKVSVALHDCK